MSKLPPPSNSARPVSTTAPGRSELPQEDDRPFAEIRKNVGDVVRMIVLHRWMFFVPFCMVSSAAFVASLRYPRLYTASTSFERRNDPVMMNLPMSAGAASFKFFRNTMVQDLTSVETLGEVVEVLGLIPNPSRNDDGTYTEAAAKQRDSLARSLASTLTVTTTSPSELVDIIKIAYTGADPTIGRRLVDQVKRTYIRRTMEWIQSFLVRQRDYFLAEQQEVEKTLLQAQREETQLKLSNPFVNPSDPSAVALKLSQLEAERRELLLRRREYESELSVLKQTLAAVGPTSIDESPAIESPPTWFDSDLYRMSTEIAAIDRDIQKLRETRGMTDQHPEIQEKLAQRRRIEEQLAGRPVHSEAPDVASFAPLTVPRTSSVQAILPGAQADRARLMVQAAAQESKLKDIDISLQSNEEALAAIRKAKDELFERQEEFASAAQAVSKAKERYAQLESTVAEIEPAIKAVEQDRLLQFSEGPSARGSMIPVSPRASTVMLLGTVAGLVAGVICVILGELFDNVFRSSGQVARSLGLPMLEAIDEIVTAQDRRKSLIRRLVVSPVLVLSCMAMTVLAGSMAYLSISQPWTYQSLRKIPNAALRLFVETEHSGGG